MLYQENTTIVKSQVFDLFFVQRIFGKFVSLFSQHDQITPFDPLKMAKECVQVWNNCLNNIKTKIGEQGFATWFKPIKPLKLDGKILTIQVPSQFFYEYLEEHYVHLLRSVLNDELGDDYKLEYSVVIDKGNESNKPYVVSLPNNGKAYGNGSNRMNPSYTSPFEIQAVDSIYQNSFLNPHYTFDDFIEGDCNRLARSAGVAVAQRPGVTSFNPLMLYGGVGLGKTHLVQAIGNEIKKKIAQFCNVQQEAVIVAQAGELMDLKTLASKLGAWADVGKAKAPSSSEEGRDLGPRSGP